MKKTTVTRIFLAVLSLALVISAVFAVSAFAEEEAVAEKLEIVSQNVSYEGQTHLFYAVSYENVENPEAITLEVKWTDSEGEHTATVTESEAKVIEGKECRTFKTPGVDAKNFTQKFTVVAKTADGAVSAPKTFSVAEYCNLWITYVAYNTAVGAPTADDVKLAEACKATLQYGSAVQALLNYYPAGNTADHPENYAYVKAIDGTANGANSAHVIRGTEVTLAYTGALESGKEVVSWTVHYADGTTESVPSTGVFAPKANCIAIAELGVLIPDFVAGNGYYFAEYTKPASSKINPLKYDYSSASQLNKMEYSAKPGFNAADQNSSSATVSIVDGQLVFDKKDDEIGFDEYIYWTLSTVPTGANVVVFEADVKFSDITMENGFFSEISMRNVTGLYTEVFFNVVNGKFNIGGAGELDFDKWYNLCLVYNIDTETKTAVINVYVNGRYIGDAKYSVVKKDDINNGKAHFYLKGGETGSATLDNVFFGYIEKPGYYEDTENYAGLKRYNYDNGVAQNVYEGNGAAASVVEEGATKFYKIVGENAVAKTDYLAFGAPTAPAEDADTFVFETDIKINDKWTTMPYIRIRAFGYDIKLRTDCWKYHELHFPRHAAVVAANKWYNLRFEFTKTDVEGTFDFRVYLDNNLVAHKGDYTPTVTGSATTNTTILFEMPSGQAEEAIMYFDNVAYGYINKK